MISEHALTGMTEVQLAAVHWDDGPMMLLAGPGSGKTRVLTSRIASLLEKSEGEKWRTLALTFTTRAADEMRERIDLLVPDSSRRLFVGTFHSFAAELLRQSGTPLGMKTDFKIYSSQADRDFLLEAALKAADIKIDEPTATMFVVLDGLRDRLVGPADCQRFFRDPMRAERYAAVYGAYESHLRNENAQDFPGLIYNAHRLLTEVPTVAARYAKTYRYVNIDEFQDTNAAQYSLIKALVGTDNKNVFVVADDDQIIYQWNGASPRRLQEFVDDFGAELLQMPTNFRCPDEVVVMANRLITNNLVRTANKKPLLAGKRRSDDTQQVRVFEFETDDEEAQGIASDIVERHSSRLRDLAVIARNKAILERVQRALELVGISSAIAQRRDSFASTPYQWLHASLQLANRRYDTRLFSQFVEATNALFSLQLDLGEINIAAAISNGDLLLASARAASQAIGIETYLRQILETLHLDLAEKNDFRKFLSNMKRLFSENERALAEGFSSVLEDGRAWRELLTEIGIARGRDHTIDAFVQELDLRSKEPRLDDQTVPLLTIHGSKGNEFAHVYLVGLAEDILPSYQSLRGASPNPLLEEERRNCFVAITRCKDSLTLSFARNYGGRPKVRSRFLGEMEAPQSV